MQHPVPYAVFSPQKSFSRANSEAYHPVSKNTVFAQLILLVGLVFSLALNVQAQVGTWSALTNKAPHQNNGVMLLLGDGSVICHSNSGGSQGDGTVFDRLTPDSTGSYLHGTWTSIAPMIIERYSFSSAVLKDGKVYAAGGEYGADGTQNGYHGETYNPLTNTWTAATGTGASYVISDGNCIVLENGNVLQALVDVSFPVHTRIYTPSTNAFTAGPSTLHGQNESMWLKLPDNSVLFVNEAAQTSERYIPATNTWIADGNLPVSLYDPYGYECGPGFMLPDGRAFFIGGTQHTAYYTPSGTTAPGTWAAGPDVPSTRGMPDAPGAMMVNGKILIATSAIPTQSVEAASPTYFYEFDYLTNTYTAVSAPTGGSSINAISQQFDMLDLPDGTVLLGMDQGGSSSQQYYVYKPSGTPVASGKPTITGVFPITCTTYMVTGKGFNGISAGAAFGDENESDENYPIVRFKSGNRVYYATSYNWNSTGVQRGNKADTVYITLPASLPGSSYMYVVANGIASDSVLFSSQIATLSSPVTSSICSGSAFTYTPTSSTNGATFTWTRAAVTGISNAAVTTPQSSNPNEVLVNTTTSPINVVYAYSVTGGGCSNLVNVTVTVNPPPKAAFTLAPATACFLPDIVSFTNTTVAGSSYLWSFGDGNTSTAVNPSNSYLAGGSFNVKLVASSACGADSVTQSNAVVISPPAAPAATSPVNTNCTGVATLAATGTDSLKWFNQSVGGNALATGPTYITPVLNSNTTYYVQSISTPSASLCPPLTDAFGTGGYFANSVFRSDIFTVHQACTLVSVLVYASGAGNRTIVLTDSTGTNVLQSLTVNIPNGTSTVTLNFPLSVGTNYQLGCGDNSTTTNLYRNQTGAAFPYSDPSGYITITGNNIVNPADPGYFYFFYNWKLQGPSCASARTAVNVVTGAGLNLSNSSITNAACNGATGSATLTPSGGTPGYTYSWSNGQTSATLTGVTAGNYTVTVHDASGCSGTAAETITQPAALNISVTSSAATCGQNNGSATVSVSGGTSAYRYLWSNGATTGPVSGLAAATYTLTVTDAHNCTSSASAVINSSGSLNLSASAVNVACNGASTGSASVTATGGTGNITYLWSNGATASSISNVAAGTYTVTVSDAGSCSGTSSASISQPTALNVSVTATNTGCGAPNGSAHATVTGGTTAYSYLWSNAATAATISGLPAATYTLTVTDNHQCTATSSAVIANSGSLNVSAVPSSTNCTGASTGGASANVSGGTSPFIYVWSNGATTSAISGVNAGTYGVSVSDNSGCSGTASVTVVTGSILSLTTAASSASCFNAVDGAASVTITAGTSPYNYAWNNGSTASAITSVSAGTYVVTTTDAHSCESVDTIVVGQPDAITIFVTVSEPACTGFSNGSASVNATGGTAGYNYVWSNNATTLSINSLAAGSYSVSLTDANSCTASSNFNITDPSAVTTALTASNVLCFGGNDGSVQAVTSGGNGPYSYVWSNSATTANINGLNAGTYDATVSDNHSCSVTGTSTVSQPAQLAVSTSSTAAINGQANGTATASTTGGTAPYSVNWNNGQNGNTAAGLSAGQYTATVTDHNGCTQSQSVIVNDSVVGISAISGGLQFAVFPNPASTSISISIGNVDKETTMIIEDVLGKKILAKNISTATSTLDLTPFASGVYFIELRQEGKTGVKKLVISK